MRWDWSHIPVGREEIKRYFQNIVETTRKEWEIAEKARSRGLDPEDHVEVAPAFRMVERAEALIGIKGLGKRFEEVYAETQNKFMAAVKLMEEVAEGKLGHFKTLEERLLMGLRTAMLLYTDAVVVAPLEGIWDLKIRENPDGTKYVEVIFASPIRSAGGSAAAITLVLADYLRQKFGLDVWKPRREVVLRYVEEVMIYTHRLYARQYRPSREELEYVFTHIPVCPGGEPTEDVEVSAYRDLPEIPTNRIRGGMCISIGESLLLKAKKVAKVAKKLGLNWDWVLEAVKLHGGGEGKSSLAIFLEGIVAGRPIFSYPGAWGGFRLRYGRSRNTGVMTSGIHPATMVLLDGFVATGTQLKREFPGKAMCAVPVDGLEGPTVLLDNGDVVKIRSVEEAERLKDRVEKILFLGDVLVTYGDFRKAGEKLRPPGYVEEWWMQEVREKDKEGKYKEIDPFRVDPYTAVKISQELGVPLHPEYIHYYRILTPEEAMEIIEAVRVAKVQEKDGRIVAAEISGNVKELLERTGVPHRWRDGKVIIEEPYVYPFLLTFGYFNPLAPQIFLKTDGDVLKKLSAVAGIEIRDKAGTFIGARMARPEAAKPRRMKPPPHVLFPVGEEGGAQRLVLKAASQSPEVEFAAYYCPKCDTFVPYRRCPFCGSKTVKKRWCPKCGRIADEHELICSNCGAETKPYMKRRLDVGKLLEAALKNLGEARPTEGMKGVRGTTNPERYPERLEKGILRAKYGLHVFKDGTIRVDMSNLPLTHFTPREIGVPVEKLRELGYEKDIHGKPLERDDQILELFPQDVIISRKVADYLVNVCKFIDELLVKFYGLEPYYNVEKPEDLVGKLTVWLAPHTSAGVVGRIIGFTRAHVHYEHPYFMMARRRNADGDEDAMMMLLDALLNFSIHYLPEKRGGKMDAPIVVTVVLNPAEVDDEVFDMERVSEYPLDFYKAALEGKDASEVKIPKVEDVINTPDQFDPIPYSIPTTSFDAGPEHSRYSLLNDMIEKIETQLAVQSKIVAVDNVDAAERVISYHFLRDIIGNARAFGRQNFRCVKCNAKYRRVPLKGVCPKCGGRLVLTVTRGAVEKYLEVSKEVAERYGLSKYIRQRIMLIEREIKSIFESEGTEQKSILEFFA